MVKSHVLCLRQVYERLFPSMPRFPACHCSLSIALVYEWNSNNKTQERLSESLRIYNIGHFLFCTASRRGTIIRVPLATAV